ncbi:MAG: VWA domain-containing protein [Deltaproteobacteria bacterium]|nr:VWA domain-containing protein [Deltaproteobacteria bacterium]
METTKRVLLFLVIAAVLLPGAIASGGPERYDDKTLSPYFFVKSDDPRLDPLPLKSTSVRVNIPGVIADVLVTQVYRNEGKRPIEAVYVFPASTRAAVYGMRMKIGDRTIVAKVAERGYARTQYERAKQQGKTASLLEQHRPNVFQMNVANILPGDQVEVELRYTEVLAPTDALYEFVYPTVIGPRYTEESLGVKKPWEAWTQNPYLRQGESPTYSFDMQVNLSTGLPIREVMSASHQVKVEYSAPSACSISLTPKEKNGGDRDFILRYRLAGHEVGTGLLLFEGKKENFFLLMMQPPKRVKPDQIPPREYIFIVDVSGSMNGFPLDISKKLLKDLIGNLRETDRFNVLLFAGGSSMMAEASVPATRANIQRAINMIERQRGGGGTRLLPALARALALPKAEGFSRTIVIATDGYVSVEAEAFDLIRKNLGNGNVFTFGIGSSVNRHLIEGMARVGMGEPFVITRPEEAQEKAGRFRKLIETPVLTGITLDFGEFHVYDVEPRSIPDLFADRPLVLFGKWRGRPEGYIDLRGICGDRRYVSRLPVSDFKPSEKNSSLRYLWARHRVKMLSDYNRLNPDEERVQEVTTLGLTYNLLTAYTSFIAIDSRVRLVDGQSVMVKQPLPLPQGVSDLAVGKGMFLRKSVQALASPPSLVGEQEKEALFTSGSRVRAYDSLKAGRSPRKPNLTLKKLLVPHGITTKSVRKIIERDVFGAYNCGRITYGKSPGPRGEIALTLTIRPDGKVKEVLVTKGKVEDEAFLRCLTRILRSLEFPVRSNHKDMAITLVFELP